jgi:sec-independent protein translocase protein TatC
MEELRRALIISILAALTMAVACWFYSDWVLAALLQPVTAAGSKIVYIGVTEALLTKIKLSCFLGFLVALPVILWQFWGFVIPALRKLERIYFTLFVLLSFVLFVGGIAFGYLLVFRLCISLLLKYGGSQLIPMLTIGKYVSFTLNFLLPFGLIFEMPLASFCLAALGLLKYQTMAVMRKAAILASVVLASALVASPDIFSVLLVAVPIYLLYEISASIVRVVEWLARRKKEGKTFRQLLLPLKRMVSRLRSIKAPVR